MKTISLSVLCTLAVVSSVRAAEDSYVLAKAGAMPSAGTKVSHTQKMTLKDGTIKIAMQGSNIEGSCAMSESEMDTLEYVSADKIKMKVTGGEKSQTMKINGEDQNQPATPTALKDKTVTFTKEDGKWTGTLEGGGATPEQEEEISKKEKNLNKPEDVTMYGSAARKVGDTWEVDAANLPFAEGDKDTKGSVKLTFKSVETFEGKKCAHLEGPMEITGKTDDEDAKEMGLKGNVVVMRSLDDMVDLKMEFTGKMEMKGEIPNGTMEMSGDMTMLMSAKVSK